MGSTMQDSSQADIVFIIEATAMNGAYINDLKSNYVVPTLEYFSQGPIEDKEYFENTNALYGLVTYKSADCLLQPSSKCYGPYTNPHRFLHMFENVSQKMSGGRGESHAHVAEGFATALQYFEDVQQKRDANATPQKHCILICNSPPYLMPVMESHTYSGHTAEHLASVLAERGINLSVVSPRKIPALFKLYEKAGGDLQTSQTKNYAKDPRHLVLLKGFSLKERPVSPCGGTGVNTLGTPHATLPLQSMPSPSTNIGSPMTPSSTQQSVVPPQTAVVPPVFRAGQQPPQVLPPGMNQPPIPNQAQLPQSQPQPQVPQQPPQMVSSMGPRPGMMQNFTPGYMPGSRPLGRWSPMMGGPQQRPPMVFNNVPQSPQQSQQAPQQQQQGSALIAQLTQPPSTMGPQFPQRMDNSSVMSGNNVLNQGVPQQQQSLRVMVQQQGPGPAPGGPMVGPGPPTGIVQPQIQQGMPPNPQQSGRERHTIWHGIVEWIEKAKIDSQKITRNVPCTVSANSKDGEPELKADSWPQKLIMQLMPKQLIGNIGGSCLKNSKSVLFHPQPCEALDSLTKVMSSGFAGCVHFTSVPSPAACDIKVLILLYTSEKKAYLGFIPNDQAAFVDRLRKVIQQQKTSQAMMRQAQGGQPGPGPSPGSLEALGPGQQLGMMSHQMRPGLPGQMQPGMMGQQQPPNIGDPNVSQAGGMMNQIGGNQQSNANPVMSNAPPSATTATGPQPPTSTISMQGAGPRGPGMMGQRPPFNDHIEAARQQNLAKIQHLRQTLEAAQRQELQYVEIMSHMPVKQIEQNLEHAQLQEMQYKSQLEEQQKQQLRAQLQQQMQQSVGMGQRPPQPQGGGPQPPQPGPGGVLQQPGAVGQQRMMRPVLANNSPGLRHLLQQQQQPQYRQQVMGMQPPIQQGMGQQRAQQVLQNQGPGGPQQGQGQQFDDVPGFDFLS